MKFQCFLSMHLVSTGSLRLVQGLKPTDGYVEMFSHGEWHGVCNAIWRTQNSNVVCQQLTHLDAMPPSASLETDTIYAGSESIGHQVYQCAGNERRLWNCPTKFRASCSGAPFVVCQGMHV